MNTAMIAVRRMLLPLALTAVQVGCGARSALRPDGTGPDTDSAHLLNDSDEITDPKSTTDTTPSPTGTPTATIPTATIPPVPPNMPPVPTVTPTVPSITPLPSVTPTQPPPAVTGWATCAEPLTLDFDASSGGQYTSFSYDAVDSVYTTCGQGSDVVARWTAPRSGYYAFSTAGTEYSATLALFTGDANCVAPEACSHGQFGGPTAYIEHYVIEGETYLLVLESSGVGRFVLNVTPLEAQQCAPIELTPGGDFETAGNYLEQAVPRDGLSSCGGRTRGVPFSFVTPCSGAYTFSSEYSDFESLLLPTLGGCANGVLDCPEHSATPKLELVLGANQELVLFLAAAATVEPNASLTYRLRVGAPQCFQ